MKNSRIALCPFPFASLAAFVALAVAGSSAHAQTAGRVQPRVTPVPPPIGQISISSNTNSISRSEGQKAKFVVARNGGDSTADLTVNLAFKGTAVNGEDYKPIPNTVTIPAGADSGKVKVIPTATGTDGKVKIVVVAGSGYSVSATAKAKVNIVD